MISSFDIFDSISKSGIAKNREVVSSFVSDAPPAEREASGSTLEGGWIKGSSTKIRNRKHEMLIVIKKYWMQIFTNFLR